MQKMKKRGPRPILAQGRVHGKVNFTICTKWSLAVRYYSILLTDLSTDPRFQVVDEPRNALKTFPLRFELTNYLNYNTNICINSPQY